MLTIACFRNYFHICTYDSLNSIPGFRRTLFGFLIRNVFAFCAMLYLNIILIMSMNISSIKQLLKYFKIAFTGKEQEFTSGSIRRAVFMLSVPMILEMLMESIFAIVDIFYVSRISVNAVATIGLTESVSP